MKKTPSKGKQTKAKTTVKAATAKSAKRPTASAKSAKTVKPATSGKLKTIAKLRATKVSKSTSGKAVKKAAKVVAKAPAKKPARALAKAPARKTAKVMAKTATRKVAKPVVKAKAPVAKKNRKAPPPARPARTKISTVNLKSQSGANVAVPVVVSTPPPPPEPPRRQLSSGALRAFDHAVKVFNRRMFDDAKEMFESLLTRFPNEVEVIARAQMYIQVCKQKVQTQTPATPRNADELYDRGVYALNIGDFSQAKQFFEKALRMKPNEPHLLYSLAATHAQSGAHDQALDYLERSIRIQPSFRSQAYNDADFSVLHENKQFLELLGLASPFDLLDSRR